jgi:cell division protein FtsB
VNNNDEKIFGFPSEHLDGILGYPGYDLERTFTITDITGDRIFNKANTDLSKGFLSLAGIKNSNVVGSFGKSRENSGSIVSKLDLSGILNKSSSVSDKNFQNSSGIKNNNTFNKSDIFNSKPLDLNNISKELPKPLILEEDKNNFRKEKPPLIEGIHEMNRTEDENKHKPVKFLRVIEDAIHEFEKPGGHQLSDLERYLGQNNGRNDTNKRLEELSAANKVLEEQIKGLKASNEYLEKQTFELADTNAKLNIQLIHIESVAAGTVEESKKVQKIAISAVFLALIPFVIEILRIVF